MSKVIFLKPGLLPFLSICLAIGLTAQAYADDAALNRIFQSQRRLIDEEYIRELRGTEKAVLLKKGVVKFESGGLLSNTFRLYRELDNDSSLKDTVFSILTEEVWLWGKVIFPDGNYIYIRGRQAYSQKQNSSIYTGIPAGGDNDGPALNMAYFSLRSGERNMNIGRQYFSVGRGIAYSDTNDGILLGYYSTKWLLKGFFSHSLPHQDNVDYSIPGYDKDSNNRYFLGFEGGYLGDAANALYIFYLMQKDCSKPHPKDVSQDYAYDSHYFGLGFTEKKENFSSWAEVIKEIGTSYTDSTSTSVHKKPVSAWAAILGSRYEFVKAAAKPATELEFAYGSGDKDRSSVTNTKSGGNINHKDYNFLYFGNYYGGYALSPRLSNLFIYKIGQSLKPFYFTDNFKDITMGAKFFAYLKDKNDGGISDTDATNNKNFVGTELNLYFHWEVAKDLNFILRYGIFCPGSAFTKNNDSNTQYLYTRLTYMF